MTDPIADMLTRIRNAVRNKSKTVSVPRSRIKLGIAKVLLSEGYILGVSEVAEGTQGAIKIDLKYGDDGEQAINQIDRISTPGCRRYSRIGDMKPVLNGLGIAILSTSKGIMSDRSARKLKVGGEVICKVW